MEVIVTAVSTAVVAVVGLLLTAVLPLRHEKARWLRNQSELRRSQRLELCSHFLAGAGRAFSLARLNAGQNRVRVLATEVVARELADDRRNVSAILLADRLEVSTSLSAIRLACDPKVVAAAVLVGRVIDDAAQLVHASRSSSGTWADLQTRFERERDAFVDLVRTAEHGS